MTKNDWTKFLFFVLGVLVTTGMNIGSILVLRAKITKRMKRSETFLAESEKIMEEFRNTDENDREKQNELSEQYVALMEKYL
ncbi:hypothetical protein SscP1EGY_51 [Streptomyces phage SscP1EGY]|nr:hypothetical protein SscP1EGY_51 [Streptomyces phage SscP1EGY]